MQELESSHTHLEHELRQPPLQQHRLPWQSEGGGGDSEPPEFNFTDEHYFNVLDSMGQAVHVYDVNCILIYWNRSSELLYGYSAAEALGCHVVELLTDVRDHDAGLMIVNRVKNGETWTGLFPTTHKRGGKILVLATVTPFFDDNGILAGVLTVACDTRPFEAVWAAGKAAANCFGTESAFARSRSIASAKRGLDPQQPIQVEVVSKISILASKLGNKMKSKLRKGEPAKDERQGRDCPDNGISTETSTDNMYDSDSSGANTPRGDLPSSSFGVFPDGRTRKASLNSGCETERKPGFHKIIASKTEAWIHTKGLWPWKVTDHEGIDVKTTLASPYSHNDYDNHSGHEKRSTGLKPETLLGEHSQPNNNEAPRSGSWSTSINVNSSGSASSSSVDKKVGTDTDDVDQEMLWEDLTLGPEIGKGSCGTVYHATWFGSDVAVKVFSKQDFSDEVILSFRQEVPLMKRLRHPNVLVFMGAVTSPQRLCIVTEFLPRGSLFQLIQRNVFELDWRRRTLVALDIAQGMNHLHHCNPPIVHGDLKSSKLLVDKHWTVKVCDFGLSRLKHETFLMKKKGSGTLQWMAPEVLRNESPDEKSDVYSFGVILWELATKRIPWDNLTPMQVIGVVGFLNRRLEIPEDVDPLWASVIESCWRDPKNRPTFRELLEELNGMMKKYSAQFQTTGSAGRGNPKDL